MTTHSTMNKDTLLWMYSKMVTIRRFEEQSRREADAGKLRAGHPCFFHEVEGKTLAGLYLSCRLTGAENGYVQFIQLVGQSQCQRSLGPHDDQVSGCLLCGSH